MRRVRIMPRFLRVQRQMSNRVVVVGPLQGKMSGPNPYVYPPLPMTI
jgi:hypothetical protein